MAPVIDFPDLVNPSIIIDIDNDRATTFAIYLGYFLSLPIIAYVLDNYKVADTYMCKLGDEGNRRFIARQKLTKARKSWLQKNKNLDELDEDDSDLNSDDEDEPTSGGRDIGGAAAIVTREPTPTHQSRDMCDTPVAFRNKVAPAPNELEKGRKLSIMHSQAVMSRKSLNRQVSFITRVFGRGDREKYKDGFWNDIMAGKAYYGITSTTLKCGLCCCCSSLALTAGCSKSSFYNDFYFYMGNNHSVLSMWSACPGHPFSRSHRRLAYLLQQALAFSLSVVAASLDYTAYNYSVERRGVKVKYTISPEEQLMLVNMLLISPLVLVSYDSIYALLACPCLKKDCQSKVLRFFKQVLERGGSMLGSIICLIVGVLLLFIVSLWPHNDFDVLYLYAVQVQAFSVALDTVKCLINFWPFFCFEVQIMAFTVFRIGNWIAERRESKSEQFGTRRLMQYRFCFGWLKFCCGWWNPPAASIAMEPKSEEEAMEEGGIQALGINADQYRAIVVIQCAERSRRARRLLHRLRTLCKEEISLATHAAIVIQSNVRGHFSRRVFRKIAEIPKKSFCRRHKTRPRTSQPRARKCLGCFQSLANSVLFRK